MVADPLELRPPFGPAELEHLLGSLTRPPRRSTSGFVRSVRNAARRGLARLARSRRPLSSPRWEIAFDLTDAPHLSHRLSGDGVALRCARLEGVDSLTIRSTWRDYAAFYRNRTSAQLLFLDGSWQFAGGDANLHVPVVQSAIAQLESHLRPAYMPPPDLRARIRAASAALGPTVPRMPATTFADFTRRTAARGTPAILEQAAPINSGFDWSWKGLADRFRGHWNYLNPVTSQAVDIDAYLSALGGGRPPPFKIVLPLLRAVRQATSFPFGRPESEFFAKARGLILSPANRDAPRSFRSTAWHCDYADNFLTNVLGTKRVSLIAPTSHESLYLRTAPASHQNVEIDYSTVDPVHPDGVRHPRFADATIVACELHPGDTLYIPCGWFHYVESLSATCSINCWRIDPPAAVVSDA